MKNRLIFVVLIFIGLCGCQEKHANEVSCDTKFGSNELSSILKESKKCSACLLSNVDEKLLECPGDRTLQLLGFYGAYQAGDTQKSIEYYERMVTAGHASTAEHADAGYMYLKLHSDVKALASFKAAIKNDRDPILKYEISKVLVRLNRNDEAISILRDVVRSTRPVRENSSVQVIGDDAIFDDASILLARTYRATGDYQKAKIAYQDILSFYPGDEKATEELTELSKYNR